MFVENTVKEVRVISDLDVQYVASADNPADISGKGTTETLKNSIR